MRAIIQRVSHAEVRVEGKPVGRIERGLLVYVGVGSDDTQEDAQYLAEKIGHLRIFSDAEGKMNLDVSQAGGAILVISNFTLLADARKGRRPEFTRAAEPDTANELYELLCEKLAGSGVMVRKGQFRAMMSVDSVNDGPINLLLDSKRLF
ncbi:MAG TPA: D-aminoacyl-tRNA deacylase [Phycisphaerae bacterium]|nr:D-aminoacyl-tRNA deacylase [Phycisphaerae bacterium]